MLDVCMTARNRELKKALQAQEAQIREHGFCQAQIRQLEGANDALSRKLDDAQARVSELEEKCVSVKKLKFNLEK